MHEEVERSPEAPANRASLTWLLVNVLLFSGVHIFCVYAERANIIGQIPRNLLELFFGALLSASILHAVRRLYRVKRITRALSLGVMLFMLGLALGYLRYLEHPFLEPFSGFLTFVRVHAWTRELPLLLGLSMMFVTFYMCILETEAAKSQLAQETKALSAEMAEHERAEQALRRLLREKEVLMREIHHRTKNNMQVINSLLRLQERQINDERATLALQASRDRIRAMSLIHETLYRSEDLSHIEVSDYLARLGKGLIRAHGAAKATISFEADNMNLHIDAAVPLGLIINELVSNAMEHAFTETSVGEIDVSVHQISDDMIELTLRDNGVGLPEGAEDTEDRTLGLELVHSLVQDQLGGTLHIARENGTIFTIRFIQNTEKGC